MLVLPSVSSASSSLASTLLAHSTLEAMIGFLLSSKPSLPQLVSPTQFTQDIAVKAIHSHNDYWRKVPLLTALAVGCTSTEADLWLIDNTLFVGHTRSALTPARTFASLYVDPIYEILSMQNPNSTYVDPSAAPNGMFDTAPDQTLNLLIDFKTNGTLLHPVVVTALEPLRQRGWLTTYSSATKTITWGPITAIGTGNTPLELVKAQEPRDLFFDAPLGNLASSEYGPEVAPLASGSYVKAVGYLGGMKATEPLKQALSAQVEEAHARGIKVRFWDTPSWPVFQRDRTWRLLLDVGVDFLNADDVQAASEF